MNTEEMSIAEAITIWKEKNINHCIMEFNCGGDSMNEYFFDFYDESDKKIICAELDKYFDTNIWDHVEFYEASDGHYMGEYGDVVITMEDDNFNYSKNSTSEWQEQVGESFEHSLTDIEYNIVNEYVTNIAGNQDATFVNYKKDFILTDGITEIIENLKETLSELSETCDFDCEGEPSDWWNFDAILDAEKKIMNVSVNRTFSIEKQD